MRVITHLNRNRFLFYYDTEKETPRFIYLLAEIPAAKRTPFTFSIYNRALLGTYRASPLVFTRRLSKIITPSFPALPKPV
jgi:hypothetical protein